ncbi:MAG: 4-(cytidine 5'-diphospho)-2-C-methyl-D-erythritol kinase [Dehalococcoidia bacterium]
MPESLRTLAHAKVNLTLEVLGLRPDGYHEIDTVLQEIALGDVVELEPAVRWSITVSGPQSAGTPCDESNLALRAAMLLAERVDGSPVSVHLEKHIPAAGGLGGGASDAAAVLRLLARMWPVTTSDEISALANAIGSDEAFFLVGGTARARGRGESVTPLAPLAGHGVVVFVPPQTIERKTPRMFAALDRHAFDSGSVTAAFAQRPPSHVTGADTFNAFERVAFELFPWLATLWTDLERRTGEIIRLAGAGPCLFWIGPLESAETVARAALGADCQVIQSQTVQRA